MPHSEENEKVILGCMMSDNEIAVSVVSKASEDDFYSENHALIFRAIRELVAENTTVDLLTVYNMLEYDGVEKKVGDMNYLNDLIDCVPSVSNYRTYLDILKNDGTKRRLIRAAQDIAENARKAESARDCTQYAEGRIFEISRTFDTSEMLSLRDSGILNVIKEKFEKAATDKNALRGVGTGFYELDRMTNGLQKGDLIVIAARPGSGKTSLAMNIVEHAALNEDRVCAVFSLEMPREQIAQRMVCAVSEVSMSDALGGRLTANDWKKLANGLNELHNNANIYLDESSRVTPAEIFSKCRRIKAQNRGKLDLVMIDYIQLMQSGRDNVENRVLEVASITRDLKIMAKELDVPVIALSQLRRQTGEAQLSDLRESGAIEQDADLVMFINRLDQERGDDKKPVQKKPVPKGATELNIAKHRNGPTGRITLRFRDECTKFVSPERDEGIEDRMPGYVVNEKDLDEPAEDDIPFGGDPSDEN